MHHTGLIYHSDCITAVFYNIYFLQLFLHYFFLNIDLCAIVEIVLKPTGTPSSDIWKFKLLY